MVDTSLAFSWSFLSHGRQSFSTQNSAGHRGLKPGNDTITFTLVKSFLATGEDGGATRVDKQIELRGCPSVGQVMAMAIRLLVAETELFLNFF